MKKFMVLLTGIAVLGFTSCGTVPERTENPVQTPMHASALSASAADETVDAENTYSVQDIRNLQDFLLGKPVEKPLNGKPYDLNHDGCWDVFDLGLMKQKIQAKPASDMLVVYFSRTGNTEKIAQYLIDLTDADSYVIEAAVPYSDEDIQYQTDCRANREQNDKTVRPEIADPIASLDGYDTIFLGYPIWWGQEPRIIDTFLES